MRGPRFTFTLYAVKFAGGSFYIDEGRGWVPLTRDVFRGLKSGGAVLLCDLSLYGLELVSHLMEEDLDSIKVKSYSLDIKYIIADKSV